MTDSLFHFDAEVAVLNILLKKPELIYNINALKPFMFSSTAYSNIYATMQKLAEEKFLPDYSLVKNRLESENKIATVGGEQTLHYLLSQNNREENLKEFERQMVSDYKTKTLISILATSRDGIVDVSNIDKTIYELRTTLDNLEDSSGTETTSVIGSLLKGAYEDIMSRVGHPENVGIKFGIPSIDDVTGGISKGEIWVIASRPSMGKSALLCNSVLSAGRNNVPTLIFSQEMTAQSLIERFFAIDTDIDLNSIRLGVLKQEQINALSNKVKEFENYPIYIDTTFGASLNYVLSTIRKYVKHSGVKIVYLDYIQLFSERGDEQTAELGRISRALKLLAGELEIGIIVLSQLNRLVELRDDKRPILSDLRQSGSIEEDADLVAMLYREEYYVPNTKEKGVLEFGIRKNRSGPIGAIMLKINLPTNKISGG